MLTCGRHSGTANWPPHHTLNHWSTVDWSSAAARIHEKCHSKNVNNRSCNDNYHRADPDLDGILNVFDTHPRSLLCLNSQWQRISHRPLEQRWTARPISPGAIAEKSDRAYRNESVSLFERYHIQQQGCSHFVFDWSDIREIWYWDPGRMKTNRCIHQSSNRV